MDRLTDESSQANVTGAKGASHGSPPEATGSPMVQAMRSKNWAGTPLGAAATWPAALHAAVRICLDLQFPMVVLWGPELSMIYNDAYSDILGDKHPAALGKPVRQAWHEIWSTIGPMLRGVQSTGTAMRHDDLLLNLRRRGFTEECYFTFSYSPIHDEDGAVGGVFTTVLETTARVVSERRLRMLGELGSRVPLARDRATALEVARNVLSSEARSFPFTALYLVEPGARVATLALSTGLETLSPVLVQSLPLPSCEPAADAHPVVLALATGEPGISCPHLPEGGPALECSPDPVCGGAGAGRLTVLQQAPACR